MSKIQYKKQFEISHENKIKIEIIVEQFSTHENKTNEESLKWISGTENITEENNLWFLEIHKYNIIKLQFCLTLLLYQQIFMTLKTNHYRLLPLLEL